jgi:hypothetical protein
MEIAGISVPVSGGDEVLAASVAGLDFSGTTGIQTIRLTTAEDPPKVATAAVKIAHRRPLPRVTSWTLRPVGTAWEEGGHNSRSHIGCRAPERRPFETRTCSELEVIRVLPGYYLDMGRIAELGAQARGRRPVQPGRCPSRIHGDDHDLRAAPRRPSRSDPPDRL